MPNAETNTALVRISNSNGSVPIDQSDSPFVIHGDPTSVSENPGSIPESFELSQNYPNPFNLGTKIDFAVPKNSNVVLEIYNQRRADSHVTVRDGSGPLHRILGWHELGRRSCVVGIIYLQNQNGRVASFADADADEVNL